MPIKPTYQELERKVQKYQQEAVNLWQAVAPLKLTQFSVDKAADAIFWMGPDAQFVYVNESACRSLGYSREELLALSVHDIDPNFPVEAWPEHWQELKQKGHFTFESAHRTKDGRVFPVDITSNYVELDGKGYNCAFVRDITVRKQAEEQIRQQNEFFLTVIESLPYPFYVIDAKNYSITMANSKVAPKGRWQGSTCYALTHHRETPCDIRDHSCPLEEVKKTMAPVVMEHIHYDFEGNKRYVEVYGCPILNEKGNVSQMIEYTVDITMRKNMEAEREQLISELQKALSQVKLLSGFLPICASCKKIRDDKGYWNQIEEYIRNHSEVEFSHSICPKCAKKLYPDFS